MENDVDLTELDDWLGTLEELQLGLEKDRPTSQTPNKSSPKVQTSNHLTNKSSYVNRTFLNDQASPRRVIPPVRESSVPLTYSSREYVGAVEPRSPIRKLSFANDRSTNELPSQRLPESKEVPVNGRAQLNSALLGKSFKEATAERDLSSLLRDLEVVEERMKELEQENTTFTRRYSLASSPTTNRPVNTMSNGNGMTSNVNQSWRPDSTDSRAENGFISAQWAAEVNRDLKPTVSVINTTSSDSAPPACLGAGDACVSLPTSPQPNTPSMALLQVTETDLWCIQNNPPGTPSKTNGNGQIPSSVPNIQKPASPQRRGIGPFPNGNSQYFYQNYETQEKLMEEMKVLAEQRALRSSSYTTEERSTTNSAHSHIPSIQQNHTPRPDMHLSSSPGQTNGHAPESVSPVVCSSHAPPLPVARIPSRNGDDVSSLSGLSNYSPSQPHIMRHMFKGNSLSPPNASDRLSDSLSPSSSNSDKSVSDHTDGNLALHGSRTTLDQNSVKKLVVRIFRPDKTTKAIMIEQRMSAGEVASLLIEKNFLKPTTSLAVVEKVPALKIERVFEEHENVAECILSWPTGSQNMIFFEDRKDHFGFIESPKLWLGEEFAEVHRYNSADAVQMMLNNIDQAGFPEWRDYLYIRKPGEKTWSRRLCVLRSSGLYTSKKNKKSLASTDLIRILVLDNHLQLYTTTGGWTRLRAPTPHGFAFKPYSAQDPASTHVFCFCATDGKALRHWVCRLRIAKYGRQLFLDYQSAIGRIQRQIAMTYGVPSGLPGMNGSLSAYIQRKSSFDTLSSSASSVALLPASSATSLVTGAGSPSIPKRGFPAAQLQFYDQRQSAVAGSNSHLKNDANHRHEQNQGTPRPVSPTLCRNHSQSAPRSPSYHYNPASTNNDYGSVTRVNFALPTPNKPISEGTKFINR